MAMIRVAILDPSGAKKTTVEIPDNVAVERLVGALVPRMNLPTQDESGRPITYRLATSRDGQETQLAPDETLAGAQVQANDVLRLYAEMQAGTPAGETGLRW